jgi:hypothetical protein
MAHVQMLQWFNGEVSKVQLTPQTMPMVIYKELGVKTSSMSKQDANDLIKKGGQLLNKGECKSLRKSMRLV